MAVDTNEIALLLRNGIPAKQADALAAWMVDVTASLAALGTSTGADHTTLERLLSGTVALAAKLDDDATVTDTDYEASLDAILNPA